MSKFDSSAYEAAIADMIITGGPSALHPTGTPEHSLSLAYRVQDLEDRVRAAEHERDEARANLTAHIESFREQYAERLEDLKEARVYIAHLRNKLREAGIQPPVRRSSK